MSITLVNDWTLLALKCSELDQFLQDAETVEQHESDDDLVLLQAQLDAMRVLLFIYEIRVNKMQ